MTAMFVTELTSQSPMGWLKADRQLQRSEGRAAVWSEQRSRSEGMGTDDDDMATQESSNTRDGGARTSNMPAMFVTELTSQSPMG